MVLILSLKSDCRSSPTSRFPNTLRGTPRPSNAGLKLRPPSADLHCKCQRNRRYLREHEIRGDGSGTRRLAPLNQLPFSSFIHRSSVGRDQISPYPLSPIMVPSDCVHVVRVQVDSGTMTTPPSSIRSCDVYTTTSLLGIPPKSRRARLLGWQCEVPIAL